MAKMIIKTQPNRSRQNRRIVSQFATCTALCCVYLVARIANIHLIPGHRESDGKLWANSRNRNALRWHTALQTYHQPKPSWKSGREKRKVAFFFVVFVVIVLFGAGGGGGGVVVNTMASKPFNGLKVFRFEWRLPSRTSTYYYFAQMPV